jgi:hypothetical protein
MRKLKVITPKEPHSSFLQGKLPNVLYLSESALKETL